MLHAKESKPWSPVGNSGAEIIEQPDFLPEAIAAFVRDAPVFLLVFGPIEKAMLQIDLLQGALLAVELLKGILLIPKVDIDSVSLQAALMGLE